MKKSEKKEYLSDYIWIDRGIQMIDRELQRPISDDVRYNGEKAETDAVKRVSKSERLINRKNELIQKKKRIEEAVESVNDNRENIMLHSMYINGMTAREIAAEMHISERTVYRVIDAALDKMEV